MLRSLENNWRGRGRVQPWADVVLEELLSLQSNGQIGVGKSTGWDACNPGKRQWRSSCDGGGLVGRNVERHLGGRLAKILGYIGSEGEGGVEGEQPER